MEIDPRAIEEHAAHAAYRIMNTRQHAWPFPHLLFEDLLAPELFDALRRIDVPETALHQHAPGEGVASRESHRFSITVTPDTFDDTKAIAPALAAAFAVLMNRQVVGALTQRFTKELESEFGTIDLTLRPGAILLEDRSGYELLPHTDVARKALTLIMYLASDDADPALGTELYAFRGGADDPPVDIMQKRVARQWFNRVTTVPYRPNCGLAFAPSKNTFHGVRRVQSDNAVRRVLQFQLNVDAATASRRR